MELQNESFLAKRGPLIPITYRCIHCGNEKVKYQPRPWELNAPLFSIFCWKCSMLTNHTRQY